MGTYVFLQKDDGWLVGSGGYKGGPRDGTVEVGYEIAPRFRNQGYATEATSAMLHHAFEHSDVERVEAHTLAERNASVRVLEKVGMSLVATLHDPDVGDVWRWRLSHSDSG